MSKRVKINFETCNKGKYEIISPKKINESRKNIGKAMKSFIIDLKKREIKIWKSKIRDIGENS